MNILYCGDSNIIDGLLISILSILKYHEDELHFYVLTMKYEGKKKTYYPLKEESIQKLDEIVKKANSKSFVKLFNITDLVEKCLPIANINTKFTPCCMLRLYADQVKEIPDKILYLDNDVVALNNINELYNINVTDVELAGVLDNYGSNFFKTNLNLKKDYLNSGVLLINMKMIRESCLFEKARKMCQVQKMFMPDQSALNLLAKKKLIIDRKYNEQKEIKDDTVLRHFTTTIKLKPKPHSQTIKPWHIDKLHSVLNVHEFDDILDDYEKLINIVKQ